MNSEYASDPRLLHEIRPSTSFTPTHSTIASKMLSSDSSSLSEALPSDDERLKRNPSPKLTLKLKNGKLDFGRRDASPQSSPEPSLLDLGREPTPPHEYVLADNPNIAVRTTLVSRVSARFSVPGVMS